MYLFPNDAITIPFSNTQIGEIELLPATEHIRTILNATILNYANSQQQGSYIDCGSIRLVKAYYKVWGDTRLMSYSCSGRIVAGNSGSLGSYGQITYVDYDLSKISTTTTTILTNDTPDTTNGFTYGEILILYFLFIIMVALVSGFILKMVSGRKK